MDYRYLGSSGLRISTVTMGTQTFGWNIEEKESRRLMSLYADAGGNYFDAADSYNNGESERILGAWLKEQQNRHTYVIGTKVFFPTGNGPNDTGASRKHIFASVDESLKRLGTDYIDVYQIHCYDRRTPIEETLRTLDDLVRMGKVRYLGASNFTPSKLMKAQLTARHEGWTPFTSLQLEYSLLVRSPEWELIPLCHEEGIGTLAWSPLAGGWLTGKYRRDASIPAESRAGRNDRWDDSAETRGTEQAYQIIDALLEIAAETGKPISQISLNWIIQQGKVTAPLMGARTERQLEQNLNAITWSLTDEQLETLNNISDIGEPSPYSFIQHYTRK
jgi:aryl-alcohol dehydrogenase-like predicted oxidoreductase